MDSKQMSRLQQLLNQSGAFADIPKKPWIPRFNLEPLPPANDAKGTEWFYIRDGEERIGLIQTLTREIEMFRFLPSGDGPGARIEIPEVYHWANLFGARIQMYGTQELPPVTAFKLTFTKDRGDSLEFTVEQSHVGDLKGVSEYRLAWDDRLGYVWECRSRYTMPEPQAVEFNNLLAGGIAESRESRKRWQKTIRALADGRIVFVYHNPLNMSLPFNYLLWSDHKHKRHTSVDRAWRRPASTSVSAGRRGTSRSSRPSGVWDRRGSCGDP